ncbi:helicase-related protein [Caldalkalibacillus mannanilyticus]|uniref:helicase-related protein n=1 Tax=Caldalkalibacillus mannanilyticus TaxID=1418 RepID=UPI00046933E1|nr:helicase-related protein [Caldalkalibacillus mannanilyticus]
MLSKENIPKEDFLATLQKLYLQGFFDWSSAIRQIKSEKTIFFSKKMDSIVYCQRCGNGLEGSENLIQKWWYGMKEKTPMIPVTCSSCQVSPCYYCSRCLKLGLSKACETMLEWKRIYPSQQREVVFAWEGELSSQQEKASRELCSFVHEESRGHTNVAKNDREFLVWAVCGAGKTELLFLTLYHALCKQQKVLITSPRRDVIIELAPRLQEAFPRTNIAVLHGESQEKLQFGELFLATTHQVLRFKQFFDLIIVDEEDAFPYHQDEMLPYAVQEALHSDGKRIYLSATPRKEWIEKIRKEKMRYVRLVQRFHGYPLAIPKLRPVGSWRKVIGQQHILSELADYIQHLHQKRRVGYLFVPYVKDLPTVQKYVREMILPYLAQNDSTILEEFTVETVHSKDPRRSEIVNRYRSHEIKLLITTTILERGVTIAHSDVAVLGSDETIFDAASLIQMAGRTGRKLSDPVGHVWFFPEARTNAQIEAIQTLKECNELAQLEKEER